MVRNRRKNTKHVWLGTEEKILNMFGYGTEEKIQKQVTPEILKAGFHFKTKIMLHRRVFIFFIYI